MSNYLTRPVKDDLTLDVTTQGTILRWYDASDLSTITKDVSDFVSQWRDKSGNAKHWNQVTASQQPKWFSGNYIQFDATNDQMTAGVMTETATTWFVVSRKAAGDNGQFLYNCESGFLRRHGFGYNLNGVDESGGFVYTPDAGPTSYKAGITNSLISDFSNINISDAYFDTVAPSVDAFMNDINVNDNTSGVVNGAGVQFTMSGRAGAPTNDPFGGDVMEFIVYDGDIGIIRRKAIRRHLSRKWQINLI